MSNLCRHAILVVTLEVDQPIRLLVSAADVPRGDRAGVVPATCLGARYDQRLLRCGSGQLDEVSDAAATSAGRRRLVLTDTHVIFLVSLLISCLARKRCRCARQVRR